MTYGDGSLPGRRGPDGSGPPHSPQTLSVASLIAGVTGLVLTFAGMGLVGVLGSIGAIVTGHLASRREPEAQGFRVAGLVTGYVGVAIAVAIAVVLLLLVLLPLFGVVALSTWDITR